MGEVRLCTTGNTRGATFVLHASRPRMAATTTTLPRRKRIFRCPLSSRAANDGSHSAEMRAPRHCTVVGPASALVVMLLLFSSLSVCGGSPSGGGAIDVASSGSRQKRGVVPGNAASRPKSTYARAYGFSGKTYYYWNFLTRRHHPTVRVSQRQQLQVVAQDVVR